MSEKHKPWIVLASTVALVLIAGVMIGVSQTAGGMVRVREVRFAGTNGTEMYGLLYVPRTATTEKPAPGVLAIHGYINSHDTMDGFAEELARRGAVVLAVDQTGHGFSDAPAFANGYGGPDALAYLHSLSIVDHSNVGIIGHSMGGWAGVIAAHTLPDDYKSMVLVSSSTSTPPLEPFEGSPTFPKNVMVLEARFSEFSGLMWGVPTGSLIPTSARLQQLFGVSDDVMPDKIYGNIGDGTAREFYYPRTTHPGMTFNNAAIAHAVGWMQQTLEGVGPLPPERQIWPWTEIGTFLALIGTLVMLFPLGTLLLRTEFFGSLAQSPPDSRPIRGWALPVGAVVLAAVGVLTFYIFQNLGSRAFPAGPLFSQTITTGIATWAVLGGAIGLALLLLWHFALNRRAGGDFHSYGLTDGFGAMEWAQIGKAVLFAVAVPAGPYLALFFLQWAFHTDARIWVFNMKVVSPHTLRVWLPYFLPFLFYFIVLGMILHGQLRTSTLSPALEIARNCVILAGGFVVFLLVEYIPLLSGGTLLSANQPLLSIVAFQFVPMYVIIASVSTFFFHRTGRVIPGALVNSILVPLMIVASTATGWAPH